MTKNKYIVIGTLFLVIVLCISKVVNINDMSLGVLYGISIGTLSLGFLCKNKVK